MLLTILYEMLDEVDEAERDNTVRAAVPVERIPGLMY